jgi:hypothetical protein
MKKYFNIYYLILEDQRNNQMQPDAKERIATIMQQFFRRKNKANLSDTNEHREEKDLC